MQDADQVILDQFRAVRNRTIELAHDVPAHLLEHRLYEGGPTVARELLHIADGVDWWMTHAFEDGGPWPPQYESTPAGVVAALEASRDRLLRFFEADHLAAMDRVFVEHDPDATEELRWLGRERVLYLTSHEVHHRGKLVLALRQAGFTEVPFMPF